MRPLCEATWPVVGSVAGQARCILLDGHTGNHESRGHEGVFTWARGEQPPAPVSADVERAALELRRDIEALTLLRPMGTARLADALAGLGWRRS